MIKIFEFYIHDLNYYLVMEYYSGGDLYYIINQNSLTEIHVACIMYYLFSALNYFHKMKIIHRDLKPKIF